MFDEHLQQPIDEVVSAGISHIGFVAGDRNGHFAVAKPKKNSWGTTATFAKERILAGERPSQTLRRCLAQYSNQHTESVYPVSHVWTTSTSTTFFFTGLLWGKEENWETQKGSFEWSSPERIIEFLNASKNEGSKRRDLGVLDTVSKMCLSPHRRVMLMLHELHKMGFERLRGPSHSHNVSWRCFIVPDAWTLKNHGGEFRDPRTKSAPLPSLRRHDLNSWSYGFAGTQRQRPFDWPDVPFYSPRQLAERFICEFPDLAMLGWGPDSEYVTWYEHLLEATKPYELYNTSGDHFYSDQHIFITMDKQFPLPPPGHTELKDVDFFIERHSTKMVEKSLNFDE